MFTERLSDDGTVDVALGGRAIVAEAVATFAAADSGAGNWTPNIAINFLVARNR